MTISIPKLALAGVVLFCAGAMLGYFVPHQDSCSEPAMPAMDRTQLTVAARTSVSLDDAEVCRSAASLDERIGPRSIDQEVAAEFVNTEYQGGVVTLEGKAHHGTHWSVTYASVILPDQSLVAIKIPQEVSESASILFPMSGGSEPIWSKTFLDHTVKVTGVIARSYKPSVEQKDRMMRREFRPRWKPKYSVPFGYQGGYYYYTIVPSEIVQVTENR